jgi:hypothetical protein
VKNADRRAWRHGARGTGEAHIVRSGQEPRPDTSRMLNSRIPTEVPTAVKSAESARVEAGGLTGDSPRDGRDDKAREPFQHERCRRAPARQTVADEFTVGPGPPDCDCFGGPRPPSFAIATSRHGPIRAGRLTVGPQAQPGVAQRPHSEVAGLTEPEPGPRSAVRQHQRERVEGLTRLVDVYEDPWLAATLSRCSTIPPR